ncbi:hypothetical protein OBBRIDRAFT_768598 [Obba rivulosa]|uniref:Uncharacterized protein n=1 Tax=Obba rivulosa TaxID=1052685 RepID=A0A8E2J5G8_9APHY|nr:hypothetical protein OBBRIDRAFT_768598 [Obba rivulosa]
MNPLPAHQTKHLSLLQYPFKDACFQLAQLDDGSTNGTALWLGAQCLSLYLAELYRNKALHALSASGKNPRAVELGSGVGLSALALSSIGWDVVATDLPDVISSVLQSNIARNQPRLPAQRGRIDVRVLDWTVPPEQWSWDDDKSISSTLHRETSSDSVTASLLGPPFDLILSSDTVYSPDLIRPLLRTLHSLARASISHTTNLRFPPVYICMERRDPQLLDRTLAEAQTTWKFGVERIPHRKVFKAMEKGGARWAKEDWEGIEIWKMMLKHDSSGSAL